MKRTILATLFAVLCLAAAAPAGPGDSEPSGSTPMSLIHCPGTVPLNSTDCDVWVHCHNMPSGYTLTLKLNYVPVTAKIHTVTQPWPTQYPGTWDDYTLVDTTGYTSIHNFRLRWSAIVVNTADGLNYNSSATTTVN